ncbi:uncharacterized protein LOC144170483 isoform X1 [Haemaphysalis longicornis]
MLCLLTTELRIRRPPPLCRLPPPQERPLSTGCHHLYPVDSMVHPGQRTPQGKHGLRQRKTTAYHESLFRSQARWRQLQLPQPEVAATVVQQHPLRMPQGNQTIMWLSSS